MHDKLAKAFGYLKEDVAKLEATTARLEKIRAVTRDGKPGKDGISPDPEAIVAEVLAQIPPPKDGASPDPKAIVADVLALVPRPKDGRDAPTVNTSDVAAIVLAKIPKPKDGKDGPDLESVVKQVKAQVSDGKPGKQGPPGKPGKPGKDGVSVTDVTLNEKTGELAVFLDGKKKIAGKIKPLAAIVPFAPGGGHGRETLKVLNQDPLLSTPGAINFDLEKSTMNIRGSFAGSSIQVGQESVVFVVNKTGAPISDGEVVRIGGYDSASDALKIELTISDNTNNAKILGLVTTPMGDGETGLVAVFGRVNNLDTSSFSEGDLVYLSDTVPGGITNIRPAIPIQIGHVGAVDVSVGFIQVHIRELEKSIYGGFSSLETQTFLADTPTPISFNHNNEFSGIGHSETVDNSEFTFLSPGVYQVTIEPQVLRNVGGSGTDQLDVWMQLDTGSGFVNVENSNIKRTVSGSQSTGIAPLTTTFQANEGDMIRFLANVDDISLELRFTAAEGVIPATPSAILNLVRIGD